ncbi:MarR family transcriptional regulator, partial [Rhizobium ruizarguesonis]
MMNGTEGYRDRPRDGDRSGDDHVDRLRRQCAVELPDLDTEPMAMLGRTRFDSRKARPRIAI